MSSIKTTLFSRLNVQKTSWNRLPVFRVELEVKNKNISLPERLWVDCLDREDLSLLNFLPDWGLAVVGTRRPTIRSENYLFQTLSSISGLKKFGFTIISGLAAGIDAKAHTTALENKIPTIGVLGHGLNYHYPPETENIRFEMLKAHSLICSPFPPDQEARPYQFIRRNEIIAALSRAIWVVEAPKKSGALSTAEFGVDQNKKIFATPHFPGDPFFAGNQYLFNKSEAQAVYSGLDFASEWLAVISEYCLDSTRIPSKEKKGNSCSLTGKPKLLYYKIDELIEPHRIGTSSNALQLRYFELNEGIQRKAISRQELLDWALKENWTTLTFFNALNHLIIHELIIDKDGLITKNSQPIDEQKSTSRC